MRMPPYVIGTTVDKSETTAVVLGAAGKVLGRGHSDPSDDNRVGLTAVSDALLAAMQAAAKQAGIDLGEVQSITCALAEGEKASALPRFSDLAAEMLPGTPVGVVSNSVATLMGGCHARRGIALILDSGMVAYGEDEQGNHARAGGWGHLLDRGSACNLTREALMALAMAADNERLSTSLTKRFLQALGLEDPYDVLPWLYDPQRQTTEIAELAPLVLSEAEAGDILAMETVARGADALARAVDAVAYRLDFQGCHFPVILSGGLLTTSAFYRDVVTQSVLAWLPGARPMLPKADAAVGAGLIALESLGYPLNDESEVQEVSGRSWVSEQTNVLTRDLDLRTSLQIVGLMHIEDRRAVSAVDTVLPEIAMAVDAIADRMCRGGRLIYVGGGTSGRLGVLDASECPSTFNTPPEQVIGVMAGGFQALLSYGELAEDDAEAGRQALADLAVGPLDSVVGITASGRTPFTLGGMEEAQRRGALTIALVCNLPAPLAQMTDHVIAPLVGPEALSGSTRLKAGTAQKLVLNMLSTAVMVRLGKTYGNLMVDVRQDNDKLRGRARRIVAQICNVSQEEAAAALVSTQGDVKAAVVCILTGVSPPDARERLAQAGGILRAALTETSLSERTQTGHPA
jgi:N-acetylmuramic acid 6-phosphate etherase